MTINFNAFWIASDGGVLINPVVLDQYGDVRRLRIVPVPSKLWAYGIGVEDRLDLIFAGERAVTLPLDPGDHLAWDICEGIGGGVLTYRRNDEGNLLAEQYMGSSAETLSRSRDFGPVPRMGRASCILGPKNKTLKLNPDGTVPSYWVPPTYKTEVKSFRYYKPPQAAHCDNSNPTYQPYRFLTQNYGGVTGFGIFAYDSCSKKFRMMTAQEYHQSRLCSVQCVANQVLVDEGPLPSDPKFHQWRSDIWTGLYVPASAGGWVTATPGTYPKQFVDAGYQIEWIDPWRAPSSTTVNGETRTEPYEEYGQPSRQVQTGGGYWQEIKEYTTVDSYVIGNGFGQTRALEPDPTTGITFRETNSPFITETGWWKNAASGFVTGASPQAVLHGNGQMRRTATIDNVDNVAGGDDGYRLYPVLAGYGFGAEEAATALGMFNPYDAVSFDGKQFIAWNASTGAFYSKAPYTGPVVGTIFAAVRWQQKGRAVYLCELESAEGWRYGLVCIYYDGYAKTMSQLKWTYLDESVSAERAPHDWADMILPQVNLSLAMILFRDRGFGYPVLGQVDFGSVLI